MKKNILVCLVLVLSGCMTAEYSTNNYNMIPRLSQNDVIFVEQVKLNTDKQKSFVPNDANAQKVLSEYRAIIKRKLKQGNFQATSDEKSRSTSKIIMKPSLNSSYEGSFAAQFWLNSDKDSLSTNLEVFRLVNGKETRLGDFNVYAEPGKTWYHTMTTSLTDLMEKSGESMAKFFQTQVGK